MKLIKPSAELLIQGPGLEGIYKQIELAGRTCYKSTDKITKDSAKPFVDRMIKSNHLAMLEHGTVYLDLPNSARNYEAVEDYPLNKYSKLIVFEGKDRIHNYVTTNFRVLVENNWLDDLQYICEPTEFHEKRYTFKVTTSIGITREFNRHRVNSIAEQSTRYCNYSKDKFGNEITFISPVWDITLKPDSYGEDLSYTFFLNEVEILYKHLTNDCGWSAQQAREVLPLCTATEAVYTAFESDWKHFFDLRLSGTTGKPHPNMLELAELMHEQLKQKGIEL